MTETPTPRRAGRRFPTTRWSLIRKAGLRDPQAREALERLCEVYWFPLYSYARRTHSAEDAQELVQEFFRKFLEQDSFRRVGREGGRFRSYLLGAMKHHLSNERARGRAAKRGSGLAPIPIHFAFDDEERRLAREPATTRTPEDIFERRWALTVLARALERLQERYREAGQSERFRGLKDFLPGGGGGGSYAEAARELGLSLAAVKVAIHRLRGQFGEHVRSEIAETVDRPEKIDAEIRHLLGALSG